MFDSGEEGLWAELFGVQIMLLALIKTHPDKQMLLAVFDELVMGQQLYGASHGGIPITLTLVNESIQRYRAEIARS